MWRYSDAIGMRQQILLSSSGVAESILGAYQAARTLERDRVGSTTFANGFLI